MQELREGLKKAVAELFDSQVDPELSRPAEQFGDFSTNVALQLAQESGKQPRQIAEKLASEMEKLTVIVKVEVAGPGFINFRLTDKALVELIDATTPQKLKGQELVAEYSDPNPFKILHVGHMYTSNVGDAIANLLEAYGATVHRVNFGGDVGRHVAITLFAMLQDLGGELPEKLEQIKDRPKWMAQCYVKGTAAFEADPKVKDQILKINQQVYGFHEQDDHDSPLAKIYWTTRQWSYDYFDEFYKRIGSKFEKYYPESATIVPGMEIVKANIGKVFEESDGAIVFKGEVHNMHTRVFINGQGLPTYETKDLGLIKLKDQDYHFDRSIIITGNEQAEYMQVVLKAIEQIKPELADKTTHITHGMVKLPGAEKMSSRKGNIVGAEEVLDMARTANKELNGADSEETALAAVKYGFLKQRIGADIIYDPAESVSLEGNSGPYLQYAHARAHGIIMRAMRGAETVQIKDLQPAERSLVRKLGEFNEVIDKAVNELMPHHVATYLYELAQVFNRFYEQNRVVGDEREDLRLSLVRSYADTLRRGLSLLNIPAPERM